MNTSIQHSLNNVPFNGIGTLANLGSLFGINTTSIKNTLLTPSTYSPASYIFPEVGNTIDSTVGNLASAVDNTLGIIPYLPYIAIAVLGLMAVNTVNNVRR